MTDSVLDSPQFLLLITIVGVNTLFYLGLTLAKLIPWPDQIRPTTVRRVMQRTNAWNPEEAAVAHIPSERAVEGESTFDQVRFAVVRTTVPQALALGGAIVMTFSFLAWFTDASDFRWNLAAFFLGFGILLTATAMWFTRARARTLIWGYAAVAAVVVLYLTVDGSVNDSVLAFGYAAIVMTAFAPVALDWPATLVASGVMLLGVIVATAADGDPAVVGALVGALLVGASLLTVRLRSVQRTSDEIARSEAIATTDLLTGELTQRGLLSLAAGMGAIAARTGSPVGVMSVDITRLRDAHKAYGRTYSDALLRTTADVLRQQVQEGDLVSRWEGDEFVVLGIGDPPDARSLRQRIEDGIRDTGVALGRWPVKVSVGTASGDPDRSTFDALLEQARAARAQTMESPSRGATQPGRRPAP